MTTAEAGLALPPISPRAARLRAAGVSVLGVLLAFVAGGILVLIAGGNPVPAFRSMFSGSLGSPFAIGELLTQAVPLIIIGLGLALAFRGRVYNIGAEGQLFIGALCGGTILLEVHTSSELLLALSMAAAVVGGTLWGLIVGVLRAYWNVNEVISSLLLNYVAIFVFSYAIRRPLADISAANNLASRTIPDSTRLPSLPHFFVHYGIFIALALVPLVGFASGFTPFGFRVGMLGFNPDAARVAGVDTARLIMWLMAVSGGLAGLAGVIQLVGIEGRLDSGLSQNYGFTAIVVALLGRLRALGVLLAALFIAFLNIGGQAMSVDRGLPFSIVLAIEGVFVLFVLVAGRLSRTS